MPLSVNKHYYGNKPHISSFTSSPFTTILCTQKAAPIVGSEKSENLFFVKRMRREVFAPELNCPSKTNLTAGHPPRAAMFK